MAGYGILSADKSYHKILSTETKPATDKTVRNGIASDLLVEMNTGKVFQYYVTDAGVGTWYDIGYKHPQA